MLLPWDLFARFLPTPIEITDATVGLHAVAHVPVVFLAFLLFSTPSPGLILLRKTVALPIALFSVWSGFLFRYSSPEKGALNDVMAVWGTVWGMRALEVGWTDDRPRWLGWETGETDEERDARRDRANDTSTIGKRLALALSYCYSYRLIGWSNGPPSSRFSSESIPPPGASRLALVRPHLWRFVKCFLTMEALSSFWQLHPHFSSFATAHLGTIHAPLSLPLPFGGAFIVPAAVAAVLQALFLACNGQLGTTLAVTQVHIVCILLGPNPREVAQHSIPVYGQYWLSRSYKELWTTRWHGLYRGQLRFCGFRPGFRLAGRYGALIGTFFVSGLFHSIGAYQPDPIHRALSTQWIVFFSLVTLFNLIERIPSISRIISSSRIAGSLWTFGSLALAGLGLAEAWLKAGAAAGMGGEDVAMLFVPFRTMVRWAWRRWLQLDGQRVGR